MAYFNDSKYEAEGRIFEYRGEEVWRDMIAAEDDDSWSEYQDLQLPPERRNTSERSWKHYGH